MNHAKKFVIATLGVLLLPVAAHADTTSTVLTHVSSSILSSGGAGGLGASTSDMVFASYGSDGWGWAGGAGGVQGNQAITNTGGASSPANETFKFNIGSTVDSLNTTYGAGNWSIANATLTFASSYAVQNNPRFGVGSGTFDIYWVGNDNWAQSKGTASDKQLNPIYASSASALQTWAGSESLLGSNTFTASGSGYVNLSYSLASDSSFISDIITASATGNNTAATLYLMGTSNTLGMIIFTGGQGQALPTLSFDVVSVTAVPEPESYAMLLAGLGVIGAIARRRRA
jgi:hypothetical protein